ncbi:Zn-dependent exopeptidase [Linnemannia elongata AG-77]|uniref:Peptide hydrolase n=1 Tax=Linnemannia elongata AG-77 TaxID=1314771 RepID=A0A197K1U7_9FUNG|nr:Zn-dependent exopeptidase [Linnemannia elongata AG-77]
MSEKKGYSLLPTTASEEEVNSAVAGPNTTPSNRLFRGLLKVFKLSILVAVLVFIFYPNRDDDKPFPHHRHGHRHGHERRGPHGDKKEPKYTFETHMQADVDALVAGSLESSIVWDRLAEMTDTYGNRIAGSEALEKSIDWIVEKVKGDGLSVTTEEVVVDYWQRNEESLYFLSPTRGPVKLHVLGLGFSAPTPDPINGLEAEVVVVTSKAEVDELGAAGVLKGRIVLYNKPFESYNSDVIYRTQGANWAQEHGAVAVLVRSIGPLSLQSTHTGNSAAAKIPAASVSVEDAQLLSRVYKRHQQDPEQFPDWPKVRLAMNAKTALKSKISRNIIVELKGRETPEEVVAIGGHIDSWDVGVGAVDDGAGCFIAWEALRQLSKLDRPPRRTVRAVFWTSEENGSPGGRVYAANHPETNTTRHVFAFESDNGVFDPYGIKFTAGRRSLEEEEETKFNSYDFLTAAGEHFLGSRKDLGYAGAGQYVSPDGGGADIAPLCKQGVACAHFTPADPFPLPYSTSPYYIKSSKPITGDRHGRHGRHHRHHHDDDDEEGSIDPPRRPVDSGYFYYHHTEADTMGAFTPDQVKNSAAVMAIWTYIAAESQVEL